MVLAHHPPYDSHSPQDRERRYVLALFERTYGRSQALKWLVYWRLFYMACSELFNYNGGEEW